MMKWIPGWVVLTMCWAGVLVAQEREMVEAGQPTVASASAQVPTEKDVPEPADGKSDTPEEVKSEEGEETEGGEQEEEKEPERPNRVVQLAEGSYVQLSRGAVENLEEMTVEMWVKWADLSQYSPVLSFGRPYQFIELRASEVREGSLGLAVVSDKIQRLDVDTIVEIDQWHHLAITCGRDGIALYVDGVAVGRVEGETLVTEHVYGAFGEDAFQRRMTDRGHNLFHRLRGGIEYQPDVELYLGRSVMEDIWESPVRMDGLIDEVRVWNAVRSPDEIRTNMFVRLLGEEAGLEMFWSYDGALADGALLRGGVVLKVEDYPLELGRPFPTLLTGVASHGGFSTTRRQPVGHAGLTLWAGEDLVGLGMADAGGRYRIGLPAAVVASKQRIQLHVAGEAGDGGDYLEKTVELDLGASKSQVVTVDVELSEASHVSGRVMDMSGEGQPNVVVQLSSELSRQLLVSESGFKREFVTRKVGEDLIGSLSPTNVINESSGWERGKYGANEYARWSGTIRAPRKGRYTFMADTDQAVRILVDGKLVAARFNTLSVPASGAIELESGEHQFTLECQLLRPSGRPCRVWWKSSELPDQGKKAVEVALSGANGEYSFSGLSEGLFTIRSFGDGQAYVGKDADARLMGGRLRVNDLDFRIPRVIRGRWRQLTREDGMAGNDVQDLAFGPDGTVWLATPQGASKYDGQFFENLTDQRLDQFLETRLNSVFVESSGVVWFGGAKGLTRFDPSEDEVKAQFETYSELGSPVVAIQGGKSEEVWVVTRDALFQVNWPKVEKHVVGDTSGGACQAINGMAIGADGEVWIGDEEKGLFRFAGGSMQRIVASAGNVNTGAIPSVGADGWIQYGMSRMLVSEGAEVSMTPLKIPAGLNLQPRRVIADTRGRLWMALNGDNRSTGLLYEHDGVGVLIHGTTSGFIGGAVNAMKLGPGNTVWVATTRGLAIYDPSSVLTLTEADGLGGRPVTTLAPTSGGVAVGSGSGAEEQTSGSGYHFVRLDGFSVESPSASPHSITDLVVRDTTWGIDPHRGLVRVDGPRLEVVPSSSAILKGALAVSVTPTGTLWIAGEGTELIEFDPEGNGGGVVQRVQRVGNLGEPIHVIHSDEAGGVWTGNQVGDIAYYQSGEGKTATFSGGLSPGIIHDIGAGPGGAIWFATRAGLLVAESGNGGVVSRYSEAALNEPVRSVYRDKKGEVWVGAEAGLVLRFDGESWTELGRRDGLPDHSIVAICEDEEGAMWFGGEYGVTRYQRTLVQLSAPLLAIRAGSLTENAENGGKEVTRNDVITIDFRAVDFRTQRPAVRYRYGVVSGGETEAREVAWNEWMVQSQLEWSAEVDGAYSIWVQTMDRDRNISAPAKLSWTVVSRWYQHPVLVPFVVVVGLGILGAAAVLGWRLKQRREEASVLRNEVSQQEERVRDGQRRAEEERAAMELEKQRVAELEQKAVETEQRVREDLEKQGELVEQARAEAEAANRSKDLFLSHVNDEIRGPMNAILGYSQIMKRDRGVPSRRRASAQTIQRSGDKLLSMIDDILDLSQPELDGMELIEADFDLNRLIAGLSERFSKRCEENELVLHVFAFDSNPVPVRGDLAKLRRVLATLLTNAVKFTREGDVTLKVRPVGAASSNIYRFDVIDTGSGITEGEQAKLFDEEADGGSRSGTAIGLALAQKQIELMGGKIVVESAVGRGARFYFQLTLPPAAGPLDEDAGAVGKEIVGIKGDQKVSVLVVDDSDEDRDVLCQLLSEIGCDVKSASDAHEGFDRLREGAPDLIFMDLKMPDLAGDEAARQVIRVHGPDEIKLVAMAASVAERNSVENSDIGFHGVLLKPFRFADVCRALADQLGIEFELADVTTMEESSAD